MGWGGNGNGDGDVDGDGGAIPFNELFPPQAPLLCFRHRFFMHNAWLRRSEVDTIWS